MPVLAKTDHAKLKAALGLAFDALDRELEPRALRSSAEGCSKGEWPNGGTGMCATAGSEMDINLKIASLIAVIGEIKKVF